MLRETENNKKLISEKISVTYGSFVDFFVQMWQLLSNLFLMFCSGVKEYRYEILQSLGIVFFAHFLAFTPYIAITSGMVGFFVFMYIHIKNYREKVEKDENHQWLKKEVKSQFDHLEKFSMGIYHYCRNTKAIEDDMGMIFHARQIINESFAHPEQLDTDCKSLSNDGIYMMRGYAREDILESERVPVKSKHEVLSLAIRGTIFSKFDQVNVEGLDDEGPGNKAFKRHYEHIIDLLYPLIKEDTHTLEITGHSYGGAIAMMLLARLLTYIEKHAEHYPKLQQIKTLRVAVFSPAGVHQSYVDEANEFNFDTQGVKLDFAVHAAPLDPVHASGKQLFAPTCVEDEKTVAWSKNLRVYLVRKLLTLKLLLRCIPFNPALMHLSTYYGDYNFWLSTDVRLCQEEDKARIHVYRSTSDDRSGDAEIHKMFNATYAKFVLNQGVYTLLKNTGVKNLMAIREFLKLCFALSVFVYYLIIVLTAPTVFAYVSTWSAFFYILTVINVSKTLEDTGDMLLQGLFSIIERTKSLMSYFTLLSTKLMSEKTINAPSAMQVSQACAHETDGCDNTWFPVWSFS